MRLFFSIPIGRAAAVLGRVSADLRKSQAAGKWIEPGAFHLTLAFLGEVPAVKVGAALEAAKIAAADRAPFKAAFASLGVFPSWSRARVLWAGVSEGEPALSELGRTLQRELKDRGFVLEERPFVPHLTLARLRPGRGIRELQGLAEGLKAEVWEGAVFVVSNILLMESRLTPAGAAYAERSRVPLQGGVGSHA